MKRRRLARWLRRVADLLAPAPVEPSYVRVLTPRPGDGPNMQIARELELRMTLERALRRYSPKETFEA